MKNKNKVSVMLLSIVLLSIGGSMTCISAGDYGVLIFSLPIVILGCLLLPELDK